MGKRSISPVPIPFPLLPHAHADDLYQLSLPLVFVRAVERSSCSPNSYEDCVIIIGMYVDYIHYTVLCVHNTSGHSAASTDKLRPLQSQFMKTQIRQPVLQ